MPDVIVSESVDEFLRSADAAAARNNLGASSGVWPVSLGGTGRSTKPKMLRTKSGGAHQLFATGVEQTVAFGASVVNDGIAWDAANNRATMPRDGFVLITYQQAADSGNWYTRVKKGGTEYALSSQLTFGSWAFSVQLPVSASETIEIVSAQSTGGDRYIYQETWTLFGISYLD